MPFQLQVGERTYRTDDLTLDEAVAIEEATGHSWVEINPLRSAKDCRAIFAAFQAREGGTVNGATGKMTLHQVLDAVKWVPEDLPEEYVDGVPKAEGATATDGSSPVPDASGGPQTSSGARA